MNYAMHLLFTLTTLPTRISSEDLGSPRENLAPRDLSEVLDPSQQRLLELVQTFREQPITPSRCQELEQQIHNELREMGRLVVQWTYNHLKPTEPTSLPQHVQFEAGLFTRLTAKTPQNAWTLFGPIRLWRVGYRPTDKNGDPTIFPLALSLGLVQGVTPALAERAAHFLSTTGMTQSQTLQRLRQDHGVGWGVKKLRKLIEAISQSMSEQRHEAQVERLLELLEQARTSPGKHKPVLSVGRDGITLGLRYSCGTLVEVASTATVTVLDRRGKRLGTVYLAYVPEPGQGTMSKELTRLLREVLLRWNKPLPRLCYVTDAGDNETSYYKNVLARMKHPRTGEGLEWIRVVDYYHASERIWSLADVLFGPGRRGQSWARKMLKWLLKDGGVNRVLHSVAAYRKLVDLKGNKLQELQKAYRYLRNRMRWMRYAEYRRLGVPLGSGVTEAACKTIYTQRLKLSGMRWKKAGAQRILHLRVLQLSDVWDEAYERVLNGYEQPKVWGQRNSREGCREKAA
jgi:hypothetical protein